MLYVTNTLCCMRYNITVAPSACVRTRVCIAFTVCWFTELFCCEICTYRLSCDS